MDRRIQKTRAAIFAAFYKLIAKHRYSKISIQNIIDEANIGRSTFYEHFETKDELLRAMCTDMFEHVFAPHGEEKCHTFLPSSTFFEKMTHILYHLLEEKSAIKGILYGESGEIFLSYFRKYFTEIIAREYIEKEMPSQDNIPKDFLLHHLVGSFIEAVRWWVSRDFSETPEELSRYITAVIRR